VFEESLCPWRKAPSREKFARSLGRKYRRPEKRKSIPVRRKLHEGAGAPVKILLIVLASAAALGAQDERKHLSVPIESSTQPLTVAALEIERGPGYPSVIHLKGDVEIKIPVCVKTGAAQHCAGETVLRADEMDLHEQTGEIEARGAVRITPR
jgi:hypothetical protein